MFVYGTHWKTKPCKQTQQYPNFLLSLPQVNIDSVNTSLTASLSSRLHHSVDLLLFNPPYVPTVTSEAEDAQHGHDIHGSWAGGHDGMEVTNQFLSSVGVSTSQTSSLLGWHSQNYQSLLSPSGMLYLVALKKNNIPEIQTRMQQEHGLQSEVVLQRRAGGENLSILRFSRENKMQ